MIGISVRFRRFSAVSRRILDHGGETGLRWRRAQKGLARGLPAKRPRHRRPGERWPGKACRHRRPGGSGRGACAMPLEASDERRARARSPPARAPLRPACPRPGRASRAGS
jgi:hypothetical protein